MKLKHHVPVVHKPHGDEVDEQYQYEVDRATEKAERRFTRAQDELARAQDRLTRALLRKQQRGARAARQQQRRQQLVELEAEVELRRQRLIFLEGQMTAIGASAQHRGRGSHRHVPKPNVL